MKIIKWEHKIQISLLEACFLHLNYQLFHVLRWHRGDMHNFFFMHFFFFLSRSLEKLTRGNDLVSRGNDLVSRGNDLLSRGNEIEKRAVRFKKKNCFEKKKPKMGVHLSSVVINFYTLVYQNFNFNFIFHDQ